MTTRPCRLLVALDLSAMSEPLLARAADLVRGASGELICIHVWNIAGYAAVLGEIRLSFDQYVERIRAQIRDLTTRVVPPEIPVQVEVLRDDDVAGGIAAAAGHLGAEMIVMGTHGRTGLSRLVLGSVAEAVLRRATVPVLVVPQAALPGREAQVAAAARTG